jgi:hypothetical protein
MVQRCIMSGILKNATFRKLALFTASTEKVEATILGVLGKVNFNY